MSDATAVDHVVAPGLREPPGATWSNCLVIGDEIVLSGVTARGADGKAVGGNDMQAQTRAIFERIGAMLASAGGHLANVYKLVIYITDMTRKDEINAARAHVFGAALGAAAPCSTLVGVNALVFPDLLVEVDAFANLRVDLRDAKPLETAR